MNTSPEPRDLLAAPSAGLDATTGSRAFEVLNSRSLETRFLAVVLVARWAAIITGAALAMSRPESGPAEVLGGVVLLIWASFLTLRPHPYDDRDPLWWLLVLTDMIIAIVIVTGTGGLESVYVLLPAVPIALLTYTAGRNDVVSLAAGGTITIAAILSFQLAQGHTEESPILVASLYLFSAIVGSFARRLVGEAAERERLTAAEVERLATANGLLQALHAVAQTLPSSFDLGDVVDSIRDQLRAAFDPTALILLVKDQATDEWRTVLVEGTRLAPLFTTEALPPALADVLHRNRVEMVDDVLSRTIVGVSPFTRSALYAPLTSRNHVIGLLAIEHSDPQRYGADEIRWLRELRGPLALALDNARWFSRLRRFGAEAERARIARDLHDRLAQSLAYVGFELERLAASDSVHAEALGELETLVRKIVSDLRETLYELRARVTDERSIEQVAREFCRRVSDRSGIRVTFVAETGHRLPVPVEQELWLILQEAVLNAEHHSGADHVSVRWHVDAQGARLEVRDGGQGFDPHHTDDEHYGLVGMRERADAVGADLTLTSSRGAGTTVRLELEHVWETV